MHITSRLEFIKHIQETNENKIKGNRPSFSKQEYEIKGITFKNYRFTNELSGLELKRCKFLGCTFENIFAFFLILENCTFEKCNFKNSRFTHFEFGWNKLEFKHCNFRNVEFDEGDLFGVTFDSCVFSVCSLSSLTPVETYITKCYFENSQFISLMYYKDEKEIEKETRDLVFESSTLVCSHFNTVDLRNSKFVNTVLFKTAFIDCQLRNDTISLTKELSFQQYATIDFQSILKSRNIDYKILKEYFKINNPKIKNVIKGLTSEISFKSVFISYSFKDKRFATLLNSELSNKGIETFLWEKDAPGGHSLEDIMSKNIKNHNKILFIASENSIKSKACQFELSEGRKKQEETWEDVLFPIHIDNYLFEVKKSQIRPTLKADEYWENIQELKRINSMDFKKFNSTRVNKSEFRERVNEVMAELKL